MKTKLIALGFILFSLTGFSSFAHAAKYARSGFVAEMVSSEFFGKCAVALRGFEPPPLCGDTYLSLDCEGEYYSKEHGVRMFEVSQMAFALEKSLTVWFTDDRTHNGKCVAYQVRVK
jgi:hypothetical protein